MATDLGRALNCAVLGVDQAEAAMRLVIDSVNSRAANLQTALEYLSASLAS